MGCLILAVSKGEAVDLSGQTWVVKEGLFQVQSVKPGGGASEVCAELRSGQDIIPDYSNFSTLINYHCDCVCTRACVRVCVHASLCVRVRDSFGICNVPLVNQVQSERPQNP